MGLDGLEADVFGIGASGFDAPDRAYETDLNLCRPQHTDWLFSEGHGASPTIRRRFGLACVRRQKHIHDSSSTTSDGPEYFNRKGIPPPTVVGMEEL